MNETEALRQEVESLAKQMAITEERLTKAQTAQKGLLIILLRHLAMAGYANLDMLLVDLEALSGVDVSMDLREEYEHLSRGIQVVLRQHPVRQQ